MLITHLASRLQCSRRRGVFALFVTEKGPFQQTLLDEIIPKMTKQVAASVN